ncbi:MAG: Flp family type IVb pilin [Deltaproteobacteria bacterium]|nr:Flp family type IVb pilin [Deltaproteobacteria bacterium]
MFTKIRKSLRDESGQGMTEYIIIVSLIGIASIGVVSLFGDNVRALFAAAGDGIAGNENRSVNTREDGAKYEVHQNLKNFSEGNGA